MEEYKSQISKLRKHITLLNPNLLQRSKSNDDTDVEIQRRIEELEQNHFNYDLQVNFVTYFTYNFPCLYFKKKQQDSL